MFNILSFLGSGLHFIVWDPRYINYRACLQLCQKDHTKIKKAVKIVPATFGPVTMFKQQHCIKFPKHLLHKITLLSFPATSFAFLVFTALVLHIFNPEIIEAKTILKKKCFCGDYFDDVCQWLNTNQILLKKYCFGKIQYFDNNTL